MISKDHQSARHLNITDIRKNLVSSEIRLLNLFRNHLAAVLLKQMVFQPFGKSDSVQMPKNGSWALF